MSSQEAPQFSTRLNVEVRTLKAGTRLNIGGVPVVLTEPARVGTHPENWLLIDRDLTHQQLMQPSDKG